METEQEFEYMSILVLILKTKSSSTGRVHFSEADRVATLLHFLLRHHPPERSRSRNTFALLYASLLAG